MYRTQPSPSSAYHKSRPRCTLSLVHAHVDAASFAHSLLSFLPTLSAPPPNLPELQPPSRKLGYQRFVSQSSRDDVNDDDAEDQPSSASWIVDDTEEKLEEENEDVMSNNVNVKMRKQKKKSTSLAADHRPRASRPTRPLDGRPSWRSTFDPHRLYLHLRRAHATNPSRIIYVCRSLFRRQQPPVLHPPYTYTSAIYARLEDLSARPRY